MRILLTNDDGYDAPGIAALYRAARVLPGANLRVIAPAVAYSGKGHVVSPQFSCHDTELPDIGRVTIVDGTPADCVRAAFALPGEPRPDYVLSGINYGSNLGIDVYYSGTVAAAREAAILGIPAIAISKLVKGELPTDWERISAIAATIITALIDPNAPPPANVEPDLHHQVALLALAPTAAAPGFWNVNLPNPIEGAIAPRVELTALSSDSYQIRYEQGRDEGNRPCYTSKGNYHERPAAPGTDVAVTFAGKIALTRISL